MIYYNIINYIIDVGKSKEHYIRRRNTDYNKPLFLKTNYILQVTIIIPITNKQFLKPLNRSDFTDSRSKKN